MATWCCAEPRFVSHGWSTVANLSTSSSSFVHISTFDFFSLSLFLSPTIFFNYLSSPYIFPLPRLFLHTLRPFPLSLPSPPPSAKRRSPHFHLQMTTCRPHALDLSIRLPVITRGGAGVLTPARFRSSLPSRGTPPPPDYALPAPSTTIPLRYAAQCSTSHPISSPLIPSSPNRSLILFTYLWMIRLVIREFEAVWQLLGVNL